MTQDEAFETIESLEMSVRLNLAPSVNSFVKELEDDPAYKTLAVRSRTQSVLERAFLVCEKGFDPEYENPNDVALGAYLAILNVLNSVAAQIVAVRITDQLSCWWAKRIASRIISGQPLKKEVPTELVGFHQQRSGSSELRQVLTSGISSPVLYGDYSTDVTKNEAEELELRIA